MRPIILKARGRDLRFSVTAEALSDYLVEQAEDKLSAMKAFVKDCVVSSDRDALIQLLRGAATIYMPLAVKLLEESGATAKLTVLDQDEIEDQAMAAAFVAEERANADSVLALYPVLANVGALALAIIMRTPTEREVEAFLPRELQIDACQSFVRTLTVWGDLSRVDDEALGLWRQLAGLACHRAGLEDEIQVGKA